MPRTSVGSLRATGPPLFAGEGALRAGWAQCATRAKRGTGGSTGTCQPRDNVVHAYADKAYRVRKSGSWEVVAVTAVNNLFELCGVGKHPEDSCLGHSSSLTLDDDTRPVRLNRLKSRT